MTHHHPTLTPPNRPGTIFLGNLKEFRERNIHLFIDAAKEQGDVVRLRFGPNTMYLISHPDGVQHILQANNRNYGRTTYANNLIKRITGLNLFTSEGDYWLRQRRLMQPAFHRKRLETFNNVMVNSTQRLLDRWRPAISTGKPLDMHVEMTHLTMDVVGQALFSVDLTDESSVLGKAFRISTEYLNDSFREPFTLPLSFPTTKNKTVNWAIRTVQEIIQYMVDERRKTGEQKDDLLAMLMEARDEETGEFMSDEQLRQETAIVIGAGQETTSNLLTWTFHILSEHPDIEERMIAEIDSTLQGRTPSMDDLHNLPYLRMLIDEVLRYFPPAWAIAARNTLEDDEILGFHIPKNSTVFVVPFILHRDPRFWQDPERILPDRFCEEHTAERHKYAYLPFGAGPRKCIGNTFALIESQLILATLYQKVRLVTAPGKNVVPDPAFTLRVKDGLPMTVVPR